MSTIQQVFNKAFQPLKEQATDTTKQYVPVVTSEGVSAPYTITDITCSTELQALVTAVSDDSWAGNTAVNVGSGITGQEFFSLDRKWKYECVSTGYWTRVLNISNMVQILLGTVSDSDALKTVAEMNTAYPSAVVLQRVNGVSGYYEKTVGDSWIYVKNSIDGDTVATVATASTAGVVKIGSNINIESDGTISVASPSSYVLPEATESTLGGVKVSVVTSLPASQLENCFYFVIES